MLVQIIGDQAMYTGLVAKTGVLWLRMLHYDGKRAIVRRNLNKKLPEHRLDISGVHYVH